jgi:hypothetical protein
MKKTILICVGASAVVLAACAPPRFLGETPNPESPRIFVEQGNSKAFYIIVDQEPIVFTKKGKYKITWRIETAGYTFHPQDGIKVDREAAKGISGQITNCKLVPKSADREFDCDNDNTGKGVHRYTITLLDRNRAPLKVDPWVVND